MDNRNANAKGNPHAFCAFSATLFLTLSAPVIYHSATQIMFVDYLPFLLISLIGYDRYTRQKKYDFLVVGVVLMILTSFYFAIGGLVVIFIYGITDLEKEEICSVRGLICKLWLMFYPLLIGVLLTAFYLVPTYLAMRGGRSEKHNYSWSQLFLPDFNVSRLVHSPYGIGITAIGLIVLCTSLFYKRSREKWLGVCLIILFYIPVFTWVLNGGLYLRAKVFIPFLPLICYLVMDYFLKLKSRTHSCKKILAGITVALVLFAIGYHPTNARMQQIIVFEIAVYILSVFVLQKLWKNALCVMSSVILILVMCCQTEMMKTNLYPEDDHSVSKEQEIAGRVQLLTAKENNICRMEVRGSSTENNADINRIWSTGQNITTGYSSVSNTCYDQFRYAIGLPRANRNSLMQNAVDNPIFLKLMGVKYLIGKGQASGYEKVAEHIYENRNVAPLCYATSQTISTKSFQEQNWAQKQMTLLAAVAVDKSNNDRTSTVVPNIVSFQPYAGTEGTIVMMGENNTTNTITVKLKKPAIQVIPVRTNLSKKQYLFLSFRVDNRKKNQDISITVQGQKNKLTSVNSDYYNNNTVFHYTIPLVAGSGMIQVSFGSGDYQLTEIQSFLGEEDTEANQSLYSNAAQVTEMKSGNGYEGNISVKEDGYLVTSIPYDSNFDLYVDGSKVETEKVNTAFVGTKIGKGEHHLKIRYRAAGSRLGIVISCSVVMLLEILFWIRKKKCFKVI